MKFRILLLIPLAVSSSELLLLLDDDALRNMVYMRNVDEKNDIDPVIIGKINKARFCATLKLGITGEPLLMMN